MKYLLMLSLLLTLGLSTYHSGMTQLMGINEQTDDTTCPCGTDEDGECLPCEIIDGQ